MCFAHRTNRITEIGLKNVAKSGHNVSVGRYLNLELQPGNPHSTDPNIPTEADIVSGNILHVSDATFETDVLKSPQPVLVDYWADWCAPCKMIAPILDEIADEYAGKIKVAKLNIDQNPTTPPRYGIRGIPTLMLFKDGNVEATKVGALSKSQLTAFIDTNL
jgi:thioredoxin 1